ncbi:hypothetical protein EMCG_03226 [[Emmonsia] crescens]|uniref:Uncharacterized protein n=1 Tax=[Emmonsia] crescens TaxID=73230 RepID=A0A0G2HWA5_9EURO|nr:hypothetical protein EMCG_03226 [Emmonsia crescens UAMH 3008]
MTKKTGIAGLTLSAINGLDNEKRIRILGIIDKLRELGVSENVSLPQLVIVGDQFIFQRSNYFMISYI